MNPETLAEMREMVARFVELKAVVGAELLVICKRRTVLHEVFGWRDAERRLPVEKNTICNIRSMTKPLVGAAAQRLVEAGAIRLDARVAEYLPSFAAGRSQEIALRHLLTHTSGLPDTPPPGSPSDYESLRQVADVWGKHGPSTFDPGKGFLYSDPGADVLGAVLEVAAGVSLADLVSREVFEPLGMGDSFALVERSCGKEARMSADFRAGSGGGWESYWNPGDAPLAPFVLGSGTTWYSTPQDYARFLAAWMDDGQVAGEPWLSEVTARQALTPVEEMPYPNMVAGTKVYYGQMWQVYVGTRGEARGRSVAFGHSGSDGTYAWAWPERDLMVLYFTQSRGQRTRLFLERLFDRLMG